VRISTSCVFYVNKSYLGRRPKDWNFGLFIMKTEADIRRFIFFTHAVCATKMFTHAECALKNCQRMLSVRYKNGLRTLCVRYKNGLRTLSVR
jgi:hypothetical protein